MFAQLRPNQTQTMAPDRQTAYADHFSACCHNIRLGISSWDLTSFCGGLGGEDAVNHLLWDQQLGEQRDEARGEGAQQQDLCGLTPDTPQQRRTKSTIFSICIHLF